VVKTFQKDVLLQFRLNAINYYDTRHALICVASGVKDASAVRFVTPIVKSSYTICTEPISFTFCLDSSFLKKKELNSSMSCEMKERPPLASSTFLY
jgi:hypothetical protein